jgi:hypothetical protein
LIELPVCVSLRAAMLAATLGRVSNIAGEIMSPAFHVLHMVLNCILRLLDRGLRRIFVYKWKKGTGELRFRDEEFYNFQYSPHIIRVMKSREMRWPEHVARMGKEFITSFCRYTRKKNPLRRTMYIGEDNIRAGLKDVEWESGDWVRMTLSTDQRWALVQRL